MIKQNDLIEAFLIVYSVWWIFPLLIKQVVFKSLELLLFGLDRLKIL